MVYKVPFVNYPEHYRRMWNEVIARARRDYRTLFEEFVPKEKIFITKLPKELWNDKNWQRWGAVIEVVGSPVSLGRVNNA